MKKLWKKLDNNILKIGVIIAILFIPLYPKLPSVHVPNTWVYIRLEDFLILGLAIIWFIQLIRRKVTLPKPEGYALILYWVVGLVSLIYSLVFIAPELSNFFPKIALLQYARRIEYMILFFIGFSSVKNIRDIYTYLVTLGIALTGIIIYGFGQRFYFLLWHSYPDFFQKFPFCFPAFLTGNEEFAKGIPLCLNDASRITSTFGGHYDLSAYLVFVIPIIIALIFTVNKTYLKVLLLVLGLFALELLNFTSSRTSFGAYVIGIVGMLILWHKKKWIIPILVVSVGVMMLFGNSTIQRFSKTIQEVQVVSTEKQLPADLQKIITDAKDAENIKKAEVPPASDFIVDHAELPGQSTGYSTTLTPEQLERIRNGDLAIASVSGSFLIKKAYALDISFTTRFQAEWPRNWKAFMQSPLFGTGYSSLTLATDNDYLRALGETGVAGFISFLFIFVILGIYVKNVIGKVTNPVVQGLLFGLVGGIIGLLANAVLIDVFEASKVAESMWLLLGIGMGAGGLYYKKKVNYKPDLMAFFTSRILIFVYLMVLIFIFFGNSLANFFVADDFMLLRKVASIDQNALLGFFTNAQGVYYRPLSNIVVYYLYAIFSFQSYGYHLFILLIHGLTAFGMYLLTIKLFNNRLLAFISALLFTLHPVLTVNIFWLSTIHVTLSTCFLLFAVLHFVYFRENKNYLHYILSLLFVALSLLSYEGSFMYPLVILMIDSVFYRYELLKRKLYIHLPYALMVLGYFVLQYYSSARIFGDNYSTLTLIPNVVCNYLCYLGSFATGISYLAVFGGFTLLGKSICFMILFLGLFSLSILYKRKKNDYNAQHFNLMIFGLVFGLIVLLPVLPFNTIEGKYLYSSAIGFSIFVVTLVSMLIKFVLGKSVKNTTLNIIIVILTISVLSFYYIQVKSEAQKWYEASKVTRETLTFFRINYPGFSPGSELYFVDTPVTKQGVWIFPIGLADGLWFIYRDDTIRIIDQANINEVRKAKELLPEKTYIFQFTHDEIVELQ